MFLVAILYLLIHPIHISVCELQYSSENKSFQFSQRIFVDDLEQAINKLNDSKIDLTKLSEQSRDSYLRKYLENKIELSIGNLKVKLNYLGSEVEEGVCWIYLESQRIENEFSKFSLKNIPLFELFDDQSTILQVENNGEIRSYRLTVEKQQEEININN